MAFFLRFIYLLILKLTRQKTKRRSNDKGKHIKDEDLKPQNTSQLQQIAGYRCSKMGEFQYSGIIHKNLFIDDDNNVNNFLQFLNFKLKFS